MALSPTHFTVERLTWLLAEPPDSWTKEYRAELQGCLPAIRAHLEALDELADPRTAEAWEEGRKLVELQLACIKRLKRVNLFIDGTWKVLAR